MRKAFGIVLAASALVLVAAPSASAVTKGFTSPTPIDIPDIGTATPYPAPIEVSGLTPPLFNVAVTFNGFSHDGPADVDALLVGPGGQTVILMSDAGCDFTIDPPGISLGFSDAGAASLPAEALITAGTYKPTDYDEQVGECPASMNDENPLPGPAPDVSYGSTLSVFNGTDPNGTWNLYIQDDEGVQGDFQDLSATRANGARAAAGAIPGSWSIALTDAVTNPAAIPAGVSGKCIGRQATIAGSSGADKLSGTPGRDVIQGRGGNDKINGLGGNDLVCGGNGKDTVKGGSDADTVAGGANADNVGGGPGADILYGGSPQQPGNGSNDICPGSSDLEHNCR